MVRQYHYPFRISFGGVCQAYEGGSTLCDGEIGERVNIYISNASASTQSQLTSTLNAVISVVFVTTSSRCQDLIRRVLCLYYYPPCGFNGTLTAPVSICPEECFYVQHECTNAWDQLERLVSITLGFINCSSPGQILGPLPYCCVDAGITMNTSLSIPGHTHYSMCRNLLLQNSDCMGYETLHITLFYMYTVIFRKLLLLLLLLLLKFFVLQCLQVYLSSVHQWLQRSPVHPFPQLLQQAHLQ